MLQVTRVSPRRCLRDRQSQLPIRQRNFTRPHRRGLRDDQYPWGQVSSGCIYTGAREDGSEFTEEDTPNFTFRQNNCSFYSGTKALGEEILSETKKCYIWRLRIPFNHDDNPRNYLSKLMRYDNLLEATNSISQLDEFVAATFACWEKQIPFGTYNVTNPGYVTTEVAKLINESGVCTSISVFLRTKVTSWSEQQRPRAVTAS